MTNSAKWIVGSLVTLSVLIVAAWSLGWFGDDKYSDDPQVAELEKLRDQRMSHVEKMSEPERQSARSDMRERMKGLTDKQRQAFFESSAPIFIKMFEQRLDEFLALSPEEQQKELDKRIDQMQARRAGGAGRQGGPGAAPGGDRPRPSPEQIDEFRKKMLDWTTPEFRAKFENVMKMFNKRMKERGLEPPPRGGFF